MMLLFRVLSAAAVCGIVLVYAAAVREYLGEGRRDAG